ncbi:MAG: L-2-amino-thiazoline-4-carboxylic acid hydrolase, partial [Anaerolineaceae bacterium]
GKEGSRQFCQQSLTVFRAEVADKLPYIGGRSNPYDLYLQQTGMALALYRVIKAWGGSLETAGELIYRGMMKVIAKYPRFFLRAYGRWSNSRLAYPRIRRGASKSKQRKFPEDWVYEFVEGNGQSFDYGIDMLECGILKFLEQQGAPELTPYLCAVDYITYHAMGIELQRDETLAAG